VFYVCQQGSWVANSDVCALKLQTPKLADQLVAMGIKTRLVRSDFVPVDVINVFLEDDAVELDA